MPKFARPNSYTGKQSNQSWTGDSRSATLTETLAGLSPQVYISPKTLAAAGSALIPDATTTVEGKVSLATNAEAVTGTDNTNKAIIPSSLTARLASPGAIGGTLAAAGSFTTVAASSTVTAGTVLRASGDVAGVASTTSISNVNSTTIGAGTGTVKMSNGNNADNAVWVKIYVGTTAYWVPGWTTNTP